MVFLEFTPTKTVFQGCKYAQNLLPVDNISWDEGMGGTWSFLCWFPLEKTTNLQYHKRSLCDGNSNSIFVDPGQLDQMVLMAESHWNACRMHSLHANFAAKIMKLYIWQWILSKWLPCLYEGEMNSCSFKPSVHSLGYTARHSAKWLISMNFKGNKRKLLKSMEFLVAAQLGLRKIDRLDEELCCLHCSHTREHSHTTHIHTLRAQS